MFLGKQPTEKTKNVEYRQGIAVYRARDKNPRVSTSSYAGEIQALFYGPDMAGMSKVLLAELTSVNMGVEIPTYVRNDNSVAAYRADSVNTVKGEKRPNGLLESNRDELGKNGLLIVGYIHGDMNTSGGLTKSLSIVNLRNLAAINVSRIVTDGKRRKLGKNAHIQTLYSVS